MSRGLDTWYSWPDLERLARLERTLEGEIALVRLARLAELSSSTEGTVNASLSLRAEPGGRLRMTLRCRANVVLVCQRCLEPISCELTGDVDFVLAENEQSDAVAQTSNGSMELLALSEGRLNPSRLIEDELLLSLPLVPRHEGVEACGSLAHGLSDGAGREE